MLPTPTFDKEPKKYRGEHNTPAFLFWKSYILLF